MMGKYKQFQIECYDQYKNTRASLMRIRKPKPVPRMYVVREHPDKLAGIKPWFVVWQIDRETKREMAWRAYPIESNAHQEATLQNRHEIEKVKGK